MPAEPAQLTDLVAKNTYDEALITFLRERQYDSVLKGPSDQKWRMTGPYVGQPFGSRNSYGVHPAVRVFYSPEVVKWMCAGRQGAIPNGSVIIKEMVDINQDLGIVKPDNCMSIPDDEERRPSSWTVMVRSDQTHDGWYWANPTMKGDGNPPVLDKSAFVLPSDVPGDGVKRNPDWYPTGYLFPPITLPDGNSKISDVVYPYNLYGAACINCHATAESELIFS